MTRHSTTMSGTGIQSYLSVERFRQVDGPVIDVRSPSEFKQGHLPEAFNLPLFSDDERAYVGKTYKQHGRDKAISLGMKIIGPKLLNLTSELQGLNMEHGKVNKGQNNKAFLKVYCWRGGMRSASFSWLAKLLDLNPLMLKGGYKAYRKWVLQQFEREWPFRLLAGRTGTGKTDLLIALEKKKISTIDLEGLANHRGSSFGGLGLALQPSTEHYENLIAEKLNLFHGNLSNGIWVEAESANLGCCRIPNGIFKQMRKAPVIEICRSKKERVSQLVKVYAHQDKEALKEATLRIQRRLGPQRTSRALKAIENEQWEQACESMLDYYDRCYEYELAKAPTKETIDISGLDPNSAATKLLSKGLIT